MLTDEYIGNQSGSTWVAFTNSLINQANGSTAFNPALSAGLSISPFTTTTYEAGNTSVTLVAGASPTRVTGSRASPRAPWWPM